MTSPTFVIQKNYVITNPKYSGKNNSAAGFKQFIHIDAYRLEEASELEVIGFEKLAADPHNLILIEWPERVRELLSTDMRTVKFQFIDETTREISF